MPISRVSWGQQGPLCCSGNLKTAKMIRENFPHISIFARARNRGHAFDFANFVGSLLIDMGYEEQRAWKLIEKFKVHDELMLLEQLKVRTDDQQFISVSNQAMAQLAQVLSDDKSHIKPLK